VIRELALAVERELRAHALFGFGARTPVARDLALDLHRFRHPDDDGGLDVARGRAALARLSALEQQWDVEHDERRLRLERGGEPSRELRAHLRVDDLVQAQPRSFVCEHDRAERLAVERTSGIDDAGTELLRELVHHRHAARLELVHDRVGVDHGRTELAQHARHRALAGSDATRESDHDAHGAKVARGVGDRNPGEQTRSVAPERVPAPARVQRLRPETRM
jgi:hypothetical protein